MQPVARNIACPGCGELTAYAPSNPWRPFCSQRCKLIDLGQWAAESYRIPEPQVPTDDLTEDSTP